MRIFQLIIVIGKREHSLNVRAYSYQLNSHGEYVFETPAGDLVASVPQALVAEIIDDSVPVRLPAHSSRMLQN